MVAFDNNSGSKRRKLMPASKSKDVDGLGFEINTEKKGHFGTAAGFFSSGATFDSCTEVLTLNEKYKQIQEEEKQKAQARADFQKKREDDEEKRKNELRKADMEAALKADAGGAMNLKGSENFRNPVTDAIGSGPAQQFGTIPKETRLNEALNLTDRDRAMRGANDAGKGLPKGTSEAERVAMSLSKKPAVDPKSQSVTNSEAPRAQEESLPPGAALNGTQGASSTAAAASDSGGAATSQSADANSTEGFTSLFSRADLASTDLNKRVAARAAASKNPRATTNLTANTASTSNDRPELESSAPTFGGGPSMDMDASLNRSFNSPVTSITGESKVERKDVPQQEAISRNTELGIVYERGSMLVCTEPLRPALDVCVVVSSTAVNTNARYITVAPIEKRNSPLNELYAVDMPQTRGCFTVRCDWLRSIDVSMVSRVEQKQLDSEKLDQIDRALRHALALPGKEPESA